MALYATIDDVKSYGINAAALTNVADAEITAAITRASADADACLNSAYTLPLVSWDTSLTGAVADIATYYTLKGRGFQGEDSDDTIRDDYLAAKAWLGKIASGQIKPAGIIDTTPDLEEASVIVVSGPKRGW